MGEHRSAPEILEPLELEAIADRIIAAAPELADDVRSLRGSHAALVKAIEWIRSKQNGHGQPQGPQNIRVPVCVHDDYPSTTARFRAGDRVRLNGEIMPRLFAGSTATVVSSSLSLCRLLGPFRFWQLLNDPKGRALMEAAHLGHCYWIENIVRADGRPWFGLPGTPFENAPPMTWAVEAALEPLITLDITRP